MEDWLKILDQKWDLPAHYLSTARQLRNQLAASYPNGHRLLHGDLHRGNILQKGQEWVVIDPKGVMGHPLHETWAFVEDIKQDMGPIADEFGFTPRDVRDCYFVHTMMAACWCLEDHLDPGLFLEKAQEAFDGI